MIPTIVKCIHSATKKNENAAPWVLGSAVEALGFQAFGFGVLRVQASGLARFTAYTFFNGSCTAALSPPRKGSPQVTTEPLPRMAAKAL